MGWRCDKFVFYHSQIMTVTSISCLVLLISVGLWGSARGESYQVEFEVSLAKGNIGKFVVEVHPEWAPLGAARFKEIIEADLWSFARFFRVVSGFMVSRKL